MSAVAGNANATPFKSTRRRQYLFQCEATIGAAGAVSSTAVSDPGITVTKNAATGQYDLVFPASPGTVHIIVEFITNAGTVSQSYVKTQSNTAGTASIVCLTPAGAASYPASGEILQIDFIIDVEASP